MRPKVIDIGNAGSAFLYIESRVSVPPRPTFFEVIQIRLKVYRKVYRKCMYILYFISMPKIDTAHARTTFQSPPTEALPTKTLQQL